MNTLNQVMVEGKVSDEVLVTEIPFKNTTLKRASVKIEVRRYYEWGEVETSCFDVVAYGNLAEILKKFAHKDRDIRVIGRLKQELEKVVIVAEHIEFKPEGKNEGN